MPNRILYEEQITMSERLAMVGAHEERLYLRLMTQADDFGRFHARPAIVRARCFPLATQDIDLEDVQTWIERLSSAGLIRLYNVNGQPYLEITEWTQRCRAQKSRYPDPPAGTENCAPMPASDDVGMHPRAIADIRAREGNRESKIREEGIEEGRGGDCKGEGASPAPNGASAPEGPPERDRGGNGETRESSRNGSSPHRDSKGKPKGGQGPPLNALVVEFNRLGLGRPNLKRGEAKAAQELMGDFSAELIARCWQEFETGVYGDSFDRQRLSFTYLAGLNRLMNWVRERGGSNATSNSKGSSGGYTAGGTVGSGQGDSERAADICPELAARIASGPGPPG